MASIIGAAHGTMLHGIVSSAADDDLREDALWGGTLLGAGAGIAGGMLLAQALEIETGDLLEIGLATAAGDALGFGASEWLGLGRRAELAVIGVTGLGMAGLSTWASRHTAYDTTDRLLLLYGTAWGGWLGGWAPRMWTDDDDDIGAAVGSGVLLGAASGALLSGGLSQVLDMTGGDVAETAFGTAMSSLVGAGVGLVLEPDTDLWVALMEATSAVGTLAVGWAAPSTRYTSGDATLGALAAMYGLYQGAGLSLLARADDKQIAGAMMASAAAGALTASYLGPYLNLDSIDVLMLLGGSAWGIWIGSWTAAAIDEETEKYDSSFFLGVGTTAVATDVALMLTSLAISKLVEMDPRQFGWISISGGLGVVGGLLVGAATGKYKLGMAIGSAGGLATGTLVTSFVDWVPGIETSDPVALLQPADKPTLTQAGWLPHIESWFPSVVIGVPPGVDPQGVGPQHGSQVLFTVAGTYR
ncbi:MAG: hypothetical protein V3T05_03980 [Myxococcota bacterium]